VAVKMMGKIDIVVDDDMTIEMIKEAIEREIH
jgi:hypothetical protein